jgi:hypothetical protein
MHCSTPVETAKTYKCDGATDYGDHHNVVVCKTHGVHHGNGFQCFVRAAELAEKGLQRRRCKPRAWGLGGRAWRRLVIREN